MRNDILLDIKSALVKTQQNKTNIIHTFPVDKAYKSLEINYTYSPKQVSDLELCKQHIFAGIEQYALDVIEEGDTVTSRQKFIDNWEEHVPLMNHMTLSLDCNDRYLGAAHRHATEQQHIISEDFSSVGFALTKIDTGEWRVILNVHAALTEMYYDLTVIGKGAQ